jgi:hypothetical protein
MPSPKATTAAAQFKVPPADRATLALLEEAFAGRPDLRSGKMFGCPGFFCGAKAVAVVFGEDVSITLPAARVDALVKDEGYRPFVAGGRKMSGWMLIDPDQMSRLGNDAPMFDEAVAYARSKALVVKKPPAKKAARKKA